MPPPKGLRHSYLISLSAVSQDVNIHVPDQHVHPWRLTRYAQLGPRHGHGEGRDARLRAGRRGPRGRRDTVLDAVPDDDPSRGSCVDGSDRPPAGGGPRATTRPGRNDTSRSMTFAESRADASSSPHWGAMSEGTTSVSRALPRVGAAVSAPGGSASGRCSSPDG
jgi:hypothetical protein